MISRKVLILLGSLLENLVAGQLRRSPREGMDPGVEAWSLNLHIQLIVLLLLEGCAQGQLARHSPIPEVTQMKDVDQGVYLHLRSKDGGLAPLK